MPRDLPLPPWPGLRRTWWVFATGAALVGLFCIAFVVRVRCIVVGGCGSTFTHVFGLDAIGGLPRLSTTALFVASAVFAGTAWRRSSGACALWWKAVAGTTGALAVLKLLSAHSIAKSGSAVLTLVLSVLVAVVALAVLWRFGRHWRVPGARQVLLALGVYACAAIGLDAVTSLVEAVQMHAGALSAAAATFIEELGEALAALAVLVTVRWQADAIVAAEPPPLPSAPQAPTGTHRTEA